MNEWITDSDDLEENEKHKQNTIKIVCLPN